MAYFSASNLLAGQAKFLDSFKKGEWRSPDVAALHVAERGEIANPSLKGLRTREDRSVYAYMPIRQAAIGSTARAHDHTGARGDSAQTAISWSIIAEPFSISLKQADNNIYSFAEEYASSAQNAINNIAARLDTAFVAWLVANKTGYNAGGGNGSFNAVSDVYENPLAELNYFYQNMNSMMGVNLYDNPITGIIDNKGATLADRLKASGATNAVNYGFQFDGMTLYPTTRTVLGSSYSGSGIFWQNGLAAVIPWIPLQNRVPFNFAQGIDSIGTFGSISVPGIPFPIAVHMYAARADNTTKNGQTQDVTLEVEFSIDTGFAAAPLSTFRGSDDEVLYAVGQLAT